MALNLSFNNNLSNPITADPATILTNIQPLLIIIAGILIYAIFVFKFYKYIAKRDIVIKQWNEKYDWQGSLSHKLLKMTLYLLEYLILVPIIIFFWFIVLALLIILLSDNTPEQIMLFSIAIIGVVRITAYYKKELSMEMAKLVPLTLLGLFIIDMTTFSIPTIVSNINYMFTLVDKLLFYMLCVVGIELIMRIQQIIRNAIRKQRGLSSIEEAERRIEREEIERAKKEKKEREKKEKDLLEIEI